MTDDAPSTPDDAAPAAEATPEPKTFASSRADKLPVKMLNDRILVNLEADGERRSTGGILIPATAQMGKRLAWGEVVAVGPNVRSMEPATRCCSTPRTATRWRCAAPTT